MTRRLVKLGLAAAVLVVAAVVVSLLRGADTPPAPALSDKPAATPSGDLRGTLRLAKGSFAGYRVDETLIGIGLNTAVGRTGEVSGNARIERGGIVDARFEPPSVAGVASVRDHGRMEVRLRLH
jgi:hypothetical protein